MSRASEPREWKRTAKDGCMPDTFVSGEFVAVALASGLGWDRREAAAKVAATAPGESLESVFFTYTRLGGAA